MGQPIPIGKWLVHVERSRGNLNQALSVHINLRNTPISDEEINRINHLVRDSLTGYGVVNLGDPENGYGQYVRTSITVLPQQEVRFNLADAISTVEAALHRTSEEMKQNPKLALKEAIANAEYYATHHMSDFLKPDYLHNRLQRLFPLDKTNDPRVQALEEIMKELPELSERDQSRLASRIMQYADGAKARNPTFTALKGMIRKEIGPVCDKYKLENKCYNIAIAIEDYYAVLNQASRQM